MSFIVIIIHLAVYLLAGGYVGNEIYKIMEVIKNQKQEVMNKKEYDEWENKFDYKVKLIGTLSVLILMIYIIAHLPN